MLEHIDSFRLERIARSRLRRIMLLNPLINKSAIIRRTIRLSEIRPAILSIHPQTQILHHKIRVWNSIEDEIWKTGAVAGRVSPLTYKVAKLA